MKFYDRENEQQVLGEVRNNYSLQDLGLLILQRRNTDWLQQNRIGYKLATILKCIKKKSPVSH